MSPVQSLPGIPTDYTSKFFPDDVVSKLLDKTYRGKVLRCWADEEDVPLPIGGEDPIDRPLLRGEVGISNIYTGDLSILPESSLILCQREFSRGDIVKRSLEAVESAVVMSLSTEIQLEHALTKQRLKDWIPFEKLGNALRLEARDKVVYDEWIGTVGEVFEAATVQSRGGSYRIGEMSGLLEPGRTIEEIHARAPLDVAAWNELPPTVDPANDIILDVQPLIAYITWNAINQELPISEHDKHREPPKFWSGAEFKKLTHFDWMHHSPPELNSAVVFRDPKDDARYGLQRTQHTSKFEMRAMRIVESRSKVRLRWQDATETEDFAHELVPYHHIDEQETWPGECVMWKGETGERRPACVQSFDPRQRIAELLFLDTQTKDTVSVLELDPIGTGRSSYGVNFGAQVLLCADNGSPLPEVPVLGRFESPVDTLWWRNELGERAEANSTGPLSNYSNNSPAGDPSKIEWWGEVVELHLDGTVGVRIPSGCIRTVGIKQLQALFDPYPHEGQPVEAGLGDDDESMYGGSSQASWETTSEDRSSPAPEGSNLLLLDSHDERMPVDELGYNSLDGSDNESQKDVEEIASMIIETETQPSPSFPGAYPFSDPPPSAEAESSSMANGHLPRQASLEDEDQWTSFEILEQAPTDHHFFSQSIKQSTKAYHSRVAREHRALMSSLPENILVRTYEDRTDLMRCLISGPEGTPYADAPFIFDVYLDPAGFPREPPLVHFHSHTNGHGRCNPNLYEDGKVCLSILGTWSGDKSESWNPQKSSLLQVFVSISGLVLVRSPYHCEPAFAKLEGTKEGKINSRLYSEKAYVLSRSFVRTALETPPSGLEKEIQHLYIVKGRLGTVIDHAKRLLEQDSGGSNAATEELEEGGDIWNADAIGSLTMGAKLTLKRTIVALEKIRDERGSV